MGYASQAGRARTSIRNSQDHAICDRCGARYNRVDLRFQYDWRGTTMQNIQMLVCHTCYDTPQEQLRAIIIPADPVPIVNPRVQDFVAASEDQRQVSGANTIDPVTGLPVIGGAILQTQDSSTRVVQQTGEPYFGTNQLPGTDPSAPGNSSPGLPYGNVSVPQTGPLDGLFTVSASDFLASMVVWASFLPASTTVPGAWYISGAYVTRNAGPYATGSILGGGQVQALMNSVIPPLIPFAPVGGGLYLSSSRLSFAAGGPFTPAASVSPEEVYLMIEAWLLDTTRGPTLPVYFNDTSGGLGGGYITVT